MHKGDDAIFEQTYVIASDGQRDSVIEKRYDGSGETVEVISNVKITWEYDADGRLIAETRQSDPDPADSQDVFTMSAATDYADTFSLDLVGNRLAYSHDSVTNEQDETITYAVNARDQVTAEDSTINANDKTYAYDPNGSQTAKGEIDYTWDLRGRMVGMTDGSTTTTIGYDHAGQRISEQTGAGLTTYYLNDDANPTGYTKATEERVDTDADGQADATIRTFTFGLTVLSQTDAAVDPDPATTIYLITDGHGSTRLVTDDTGATLECYDYTAFGQPIGFITSQALTDWQFGGDGIYDGATGWTYHLARWRSDFRFVSYDSFEADPASPANLHKYLYGNGNAIMGVDPTGHFGLLKLLAVVGIAGLLVGGIKLSCWWPTHVANSAPVRPITINIYVPSASDPSVPLNCSQVATELKSMFQPITSKMNCQVTFNVIGTAPPAQLGWTYAKGYKSTWNGVMRHQDGFFGQAASVESPGKPDGAYSLKGIKLWIDAAKDNKVTPNYAQMWANIFAHEQIDHGIVGHYDTRDTGYFTDGTLWVGQLEKLPPDYLLTFRKAMQAN